MYEVGLEFGVWSLVIDLIRRSKNSKVTVMVDRAKSIFQVDFTYSNYCVLVSKCTILSSKEAKGEGES